MKCPYCGFHKSQVVDSRQKYDDAISRRRMCFQCGKRWSTQEIIVKAADGDLRPPTDTIILGTGKDIEYEYVLVKRSRGRYDVE